MVLTQIELEFWNTVISGVSTFIVIAVAIGGGIKYFQEQKRDRVLKQNEFNWRKSQFVMGLAKELVENENYQFAFRIIEFRIGLPPGSTLNKILGPKIYDLSTTEMDVRYKIDAYLEFFERLHYYIFVTHTMALSDMEIFGWQIIRIGTDKDIRDFAKSVGFETTLDLYEECRRLFCEKEWFSDVLEFQRIRERHELSSQALGKADPRIHYKRKK